jgi:hypothetical protein
LQWKEASAQRAQTEELLRDFIEAEIRSLLLAFEEGGLRGLVFSIESRNIDKGNFYIYLVLSPNNQPISGNISIEKLTPVTALDNPGWNEIRYQRLGATSPDEHVGLTRVFLVRGFKILVGREITWREPRLNMKKK